jgi:hypothetical protein
MHGRILKKRNNIFPCQFSRTKARKMHDRILKKETTFFPVSSHELKREKCMVVF